VQPVAIDELLNKVCIAYSQAGCDKAHAMSARSLDYSHRPCNQHTALLAQIQSKLSFQPSPKREKPTEEKPADDEVGGVMHLPRPSAVRRQRRPTPVSAKSVR